MKKYTLEFIISDKGELHVSAQNSGFAPFELMGLLEWKKGDIEKQIFGDIKPDIVNRTVIKDEDKANWLVWGGWVGNSDKRIEGAKCSSCGFKHPTVFESKDNLYKICPSCGSKMSVKIE